MKSKFFILFLLGVLNLSFASNSTQNLFEDQMLDQGFFEEFLSEFSSSIERFTENRIYIKPSCIKSTHLGMVFEQDGIVFHLPMVLSDHSGAYIPLNSQAKPMDITFCPCGWIKFEGDPCKNPNCPYK
jgi:hypothetical protein